MRYILVPVVVISMTFLPPCLLLVMTSGGTFKVILGYSIPLDLPMPMGINYVHNFQFQYPTVDNASQVAYVQQGARHSKAVTRSQFYAIIENMLDNPHDVEEINPYTEAWRSGQLAKDCFLLYPQCPQGKTLLDNVSYYF